MQPALGGSAFLRGYDPFRFRGEKLVGLAGEYRLELVPKLELALIYETGKAFRTMSGFDVRNLLYSYGAGIRLKSRREVRMRLDVMRGPEGTRLDLKLGPSF